MLIHHLGLRANSDVPADTLAIWQEHGWHAGAHPDTDPDNDYTYPPPVLPDPDAPEPEAPFDPAAHNVDDVVAHLETADDNERARVLEAEVAGKARKTVTEWTPSPVPAPTEPSTTVDNTTTTNTEG